MRSRQKALARTPPGMVGHRILRRGSRFVRRFARLSKSDLLLHRRRALRIGGYVMELPRDMAWAFRDGSYYERNVEAWLRRLLAARESSVFYDVGANYGYYTLVAAGCGARVVSFEPVSATYEVLRRNVRRNLLADVATVRIALGDTIGSTLMTLYSSSGNNGAVRRSRGAVAHLTTLGVEEVDLRTLDDVLAEGSFVPPTVMKLDTEGSELRILRGARRVLAAHRPILIIEHDSDIARDAGYCIMDVLRELGQYSYSSFGLADSERGDATDVTLYPVDEFESRPLGTVIAFPPGQPIPGLP